MIDVDGPPGIVEARRPFLALLASLEGMGLLLRHAGQYNPFPVPEVALMGGGEVVLAHTVLELDERDVAGLANVLTAATESLVICLSAAGEGMT